MTNYDIEIESLIKNRFNLNQEICDEFLKPLVYAIVSHDSEVEKTKGDKGIVLTVKTKNEKALNRDVNLKEYSGVTVRLMMKIDLETVTLDYNFFSSKDHVYKSNKKHLKYILDKEKKKFFIMCDRYASSYEGEEELQGSEIVESTSKEYTLDSIILTEIKNVKRLNSNKNEITLLSEALRDIPPRVIDGNFTSCERLIENQAIKYSSPNKYELIYLDEDHLNKFVKASKPVKRLDKDESRGLKRKYTYKKPN